MLADGSSLIILNKTKCEEHSECSGEKEMKLMKTGCNILPNKTQYLHNETWRTLEIKNGSFEITVDKPFLKVFHTIFQGKTNVPLNKSKNTEFAKKLEVTPVFKITRPGRK